MARLGEYIFNQFIIKPVTGGYLLEVDIVRSEDEPIKDKLTKAEEKKIGIWSDESAKLRTRVFLSLEDVIIKIKEYRL